MKDKKKTGTGKFLGFGEILSFAIKREEEAAEAYRSMIEVAAKSGLAEFLQELQQEEIKHKMLLQNLAQDRAETIEPLSVADLMITDDLPDEAPDREMSFQDLLIFAAKKEQKSADLYSNLAARMTGDDKKKLFEFLAGQEKVHKLRLEIEYEKHVLKEN